MTSKIKIMYNNKSTGLYNRPMNRNFTNDYQDYTFASDCYPEYTNYQASLPQQYQTHNYQQYWDTRERPSDRNERQNVNNRKFRDRDHSGDFRGRNKNFKQCRERGKERSSSVNSNCSNIVHNEYKLYICPGCQLQFECFPKTGRYVGKVPLILTCKHTICQDCIIKTTKNCNVICPICEIASVLPYNYSNENIQEVFPPNFYIFGLISWCKSQSNNVRDLTLVPDTKPVSKKIDLELSANSGVTCCFLNCNRVATLRCQDCKDVYCQSCCISVHNSAKSLWSHKQVSMSNGDFFIELEKCKEHNMNSEIFCKTCNEEACCYCFLEKHEGHEKEYLAKLTESDQTEFAAYRKKAEAILKQLLYAQMQLQEIQNFNNSTAEKQISVYFTNLYARLQLIEKNLRHEVSTFQDTDKSSKGLENISDKIKHSVHNVNKILLACEAAEVKKINLREIFNKLKEVQNLPCYLLNEQGDKLEPLCFSIDSVLDHLEDFFKINKSKELEYTLVCEDELPEDYVKPKIIDSDIESTVSSLKQSVTESSKKKKISIKAAFTDTLKTSDKEMIEVTHIESLEKFYVQQKKVQYRLMQMNRDIENYINLATPVEQPQLNDLYLVLYTNKNEKSWCRGRITDIKNGEPGAVKYEVFFIDYGTTLIVDISKLREITPGIAQRKAFAIQCELYNPTFVEWSKTAHVYMGKIINGKEIYMLVKNIQSGIHQVDLLVSSSDRGLTSVIDILIHTCKNALNNSEDSLDYSAVSNQSYHYTQDYKIFSNNTKFKKNQIENVIIANIVDPHLICVHIAAHADSLKKLISSMKSHYKRSTSTFIPVEGSYVVVENKDPIRGNWHRAFIKKVDMTTEQVQVKCVDWGTNLIVPFGSIRMLTDNFTRLESQAIFIKLAHIAPYDMADAWSDRATIFLQRFFRHQDVLKMIVHEEDPLEVVLFEVQVNVDICINTLLVQEKMADSVGKLSQVLEWPQSENSQIHFSNTESFVESLIKKVDENEEESEDEEDKNLVKQQIDIVKFVSPDVIYIKFLIHEERERLLFRELQIHYAKEKQVKDSWAKNEMCVIVYKEFFARGMILGPCVDENKYKINVIDNADEVMESKENIYIYAPYFSKYKGLVYNAHLAGIRPAGGNTWSLSSIEATQEIFNAQKGYIFASKIAGDTSKKSLPMKIWYSQTKIGGALEAAVTKYISINNFLVRLGYAYKLATEKPPLVDSEDNELASKTDSEEALNSSIESKDWNAIMQEEEEKKTKQKQDSPYRIREVEIKDWKPAFPITKMKFNAWVTCAETEGILYLREENLQVAYKELEKNLKEYFDNKPDPKPDLNHKWQPGQLCSIAYGDHWYRGKVVKINNPDEIVVIMIDFGSDHTVPPKDLYREVLHPEIQAFASKIKLNRIYAKCGKWLTSDYETLLDIVTEYSRIEIVGSLDEDIPLAEVYTDKGVNINQLLVSKCPNLSRSEHQAANTDDDDDDNVVIEAEESLELKGSTVDTTSFKFKVEQLPDENKCLMFIITILSYNKIVIKKPGFVQDENLTKISAEIQKYADFQPVIENIELNMPCIAQYAEDNLWYRAQVYDVDGLSGGYVLVYYVDFGNVESVLVSEVKMMRPEWFELPITCHIAKLNFELKTESHLEYVHQYIRKLFGKVKLTEFIQRNPLVVSLLEEDGELTYQSLIKSGFIVTPDEAVDGNVSEIQS